MSTRDVTAAGGSLRSRISLAPLQKFGRSLMLPIAALPAAAIAIWHEAKPENKKLVGGIMLSAALTAFLTGTSMALVNALGIKDGFGFSAGLFDFVLNWNIATKPALLILIGLGYAALYYVLLRFVIRKWNLRTPGREEDGDEGSGSFLEQDTKA